MLLWKKLFYQLQHIHVQSCIQSLFFENESFWAQRRIKVDGLIEQQ